MFHEGSAKATDTMRIAAATHCTSAPHDKSSSISALSENGGRLYDILHFGGSQHAIDTEDSVLLVGFAEYSILVLPRTASSRFQHATHSQRYIEADQLLAAVSLLMNVPKPVPTGQDAQCQGPPYAVIAARSNAYSFSPHLLFHQHQFESICSRLRAGGLWSAATILCTSKLYITQSLC